MKPTKQKRGSVTVHPCSVTERAHDIASAQDLNTAEVVRCGLLLGLPRDPKWTAKQRAEWEDAAAIARRKLAVIA